ncbi:MAG: twin-arginine translocase subunit TatC, partial [Nitrososphaerales archaeon]
MDRERPLMEHLQELRGRLVRIALAVGIITAVSLTVGIDLQDYNGIRIPVPYIDPLNNLSIQFLTKMQQDLVPENVTLIQQKPGEAFFAQFYIAILLGVIFGMPVIVKQLVSFIAPGLY